MLLAHMLFGVCDELVVVLAPYRLPARTVDLLRHAVLLSSRQSYLGDPNTKHSESQLGRQHTFEPRLRSWASHQLRGRGFFRLAYSIQGRIGVRRKRGG